MKRRSNQSSNYRDTNALLVSKKMEREKKTKEIPLISFLLIAITRKNWKNGNNISQESTLGPKIFIFHLGRREGGKY